MKSHSVERIPAVARLSKLINEQQNELRPIVVRDIKYVLEGAEKLDQEVKLKSTQIATITKEKSDLQQLVTAKTSEVQSKNSLLVQKTTELQSKDSLLLQKEQLLSELRIREENQLKEEYISILHQLNPKVYSANYEDWSGKAQGAKNIIDQGNLKAIRKNLPVHKQQLAQKIETEKLAIAAKEAEKLDKAKEEAVSILHQLHPHAYPVNYEDWPAHIKARKLLDSGNLQVIEKNLVVYRELLKKELARQKEEVQNKTQLFLQKEQELKSLNDTFTKSISTKEKELKILNDTLLTKNTTISEVSHKVKKTNRKLAAKDKLLSDKDQEIEALKALLAQKDELLEQKEIEKQELLAKKEEEMSGLKILSLAKLVESQEKGELLEQKEGELLVKNVLINQSLTAIDKLQQDLSHKDNEIYNLNVLNQRLSHIDSGIQITGNEMGTQVEEIHLAGNHESFEFS